MANLSFFMSCPEYGNCYTDGKGNYYRCTGFSVEKIEEDKFKILEIYKRVTKSLIYLKLE